MKAGLSEPEPLADTFIGAGVRVESKREPEQQSPMRALGCYELQPQPEPLANHTSPRATARLSPKYTELS